MKFLHKPFVEKVIVVEKSSSGMSVFEAFVKIVTMLRMVRLWVTIMVIFVFAKLRQQNIGNHLTHLTCGRYCSQLKRL